MSTFDTPPPPTVFLDNLFRVYKHDLTIRSFDLNASLRFYASKRNKGGWTAEFGPAISILLTASHTVHYIESRTGPSLGTRLRLHDGRATLNGGSIGPISIRPFLIMSRNVKLIGRSFSIGVRYTQELMPLIYQVELDGVMKEFNLKRHDLSLSLRMNGFSRIP